MKKTRNAALVADFKLCGNMSAAGRKHSVSRDRARQIIHRAYREQAGIRFLYVKNNYAKGGSPDFGDQYGVEITSTPEQMAREIGWIA